MVVDASDQNLTLLTSGRSCQTIGCLVAVNHAVSLQKIILHRPPALYPSYGLARLYPMISGSVSERLMAARAVDMALLLFLS